MAIPHYDDDGAEEPAGKQRRDEFDCPVCDANNPCEDKFGPGDEIRCFFCGQEFEVVVTDAGRWTFKELL